MPSHWSLQPLAYNQVGLWWLGSWLASHQQPSLFIPVDLTNNSFFYMCRKMIGKQLFCSRIGGLLTLDWDVLWFVMEGCQDRPRRKIAPNVLYFHMCPISQLNSPESLKAELNSFCYNIPGWLWVKKGRLWACLAFLMSLSVLPMMCI